MTGFEDEAYGGLVCDNCKAEFENNGMSKNDFRKHARDLGWYCSDMRDYCAECNKQRIAVGGRGWDV